jgi:hypothetical protein
MLAVFWGQKEDPSLEACTGPVSMLCHSYHGRHGAMERKLTNQQGGTDDAEQVVLGQFF